VVGAQAVKVHILTKLHKRTKLFASVVANSIKYSIIIILFLVSGTLPFNHVEIIARNLGISLHSTGQGPSTRNALVLGEVYSFVQHPLSFFYQ